MEKHIVKSTEPAPFSRILVDRAEPSTPRVFKRGNPLTKGESVPRRFLQVLSSPDTRPFSKGSGRLELAQRIASSHNPLTARVLVNRVWMHHFGQGLVPTPSDFGQRSETPSHPELLDWLASRFMEEGWSLKKLHRWILLSATYQQRSQPPTDSPSALRALERDPANKLLWRMNPHKLRFEAMRDAWLSCSGEIDSRVGGKPDAFFASTNVRRSLYGFVDRQAVPTVLSTFDFANPDLSIPQRNDTIVPQQALFLLNHPYLAARARALVRSAFPSRDAVPSPDRIRILYERILQREPLPRETVAAMDLVEPPTAAAPAPPGAGLNPWEQLAQMLLISNEFLFVD
jgi:hypothetical protein